jgi:hypothetical protein
MVLMGINRIYVMKQAGLCVDESCGGFGLISFIFWGHNLGDQLKKNSQIIASHSSQLLLIPHMNDLGWF